MLNAEHILESLSETAKVVLERHFFNKFRVELIEAYGMPKVAKDFAQPTDLPALKEEPIEPAPETFREPSSKPKLVVPPALKPERNRGKTGT